MAGRFTLDTVLRFNVRSWLEAQTCTRAVSRAGGQLVRSVCVLCVVLGAAMPAWTRHRDETSLRRWVGTWAASPQLTEENNLPPAPGFADATLRQVVRVSIGGKTLRVRFSNEFGSTELTLLSARVAGSAGGGAIQAATDRPVTFRGRSSVSIPPGAPMISDPLDFDLPPLSDLAVTIHVRGAPSGVTGHPGSRTTSFLQAGNAATSAELPRAVRVEHWYFLSGVDVLASADAASIAILGDSITDGRGSTTDGHDRWPDNLARRLRATPATSQIGVLNMGIGGNRLLRDGLGPNVLARFDRDVLAQSGVRWLIVVVGINDIGTAADARARGEPAATAEDIILAYEQIVERAHAHGIRVYGATIMPFEGFTYMNYCTPEGEAVRRRVNDWIRTGGRFDGVIDFDAVTRDPDRPTRLSRAVDGGDHLHPSAAGYRIMADAVDLSLFALRSGGR
jgi:lysophospholipase L1-like esterase